MRKILIFTATLAILSCSVAHIQSEIRSGKVPSRDVNLGGWLVAEHWMTGDSVAWKGVPGNIVNQGEYRAMEHLG